MKRETVFACALVVALVGAGCGGSGSPGTPTASPQVAGQYEVAVRLTDNSCGAGVSVAPQPTSVTHTPGASSFSLRHGGLNVTGTVSRDGAFTTQPLDVQDPQGPARLSIAGRFATTGFEATVTVDVQRAAPAGACRYLVAWTGTKQGAPNVIG